SSLPPGFPKPPFWVRLRFWILRRRHPDGFLYYVDPPEAPEGLEDAFYDPAWDDWRPPRRYGGLWTCLLVVILAMSTFVLVGQKASKPLSTTPNAASLLHQNPKANQASGAVPFNSRAPEIKFTGKTGEFRRRFLPSAGLAIVSVFCNCHTILGVEIFDADQNLVTVPVNNDGLYSGSFAVRLNLDWNILEVQADGPWGVSIAFPDSKNLVELPQTYLSGSDKVQGPFAGGRSIKVDASFLPISASQVTVNLVDATGKVISVLISRSGRFETSLTVGLPPGPVYIDVRSSAFWTISLTPVA
ncbi:MAG: hypothetical protein WCO31_02980, partial [Actinomycetes bacterium]